MDHQVIEPNTLMVLPFVVLLATIALGPVAFPHWWHKHYPKVALALGAITLAYYLFGLHATTRVAHVAYEYVSFIALIGSLYIVSGGIHLTVKGEATPRDNVLFLLVGAVIANVLGTTGASMLLIRPWIRMNKYRITAHHIAFFIFIVSNVGGCLTPIGDPPLFLGYLKGIPFWWVIKNCWPMWCVGVGILLAMFYVVDRRNYLKAPRAVREEMAEPKDEWTARGLNNLFFLAMILGSVFIAHPIFLREGIMLVAALASYFLTSKPVHEANDFNFEPLREVAILFIGIFATMIPALDWLQLNAGRLGDPSASVFYWGCGLLSGILDNAPTYLSFLSTIFGLCIDPAMVAQVQGLIAGGGLEALSGAGADQARAAFQTLQEHHNIAGGHITVEQIEIAILLSNPVFNQLLVAISVGAVFFGANTYIGNGPNFMVKSISDQQKVHTPTFMGYIFKFTLPFMIPMIFIVWLIFFWNR